jgi:NTP pyrophosphatase (non-canonical NTP hydrolase)
MDNINHVVLELDGVRYKVLGLAANRESIAELAPNHKDNSDITSAEINGIEFIVKKLPTDNVELINAIRLFAENIYNTANKNGKYIEKPKLPSLIMHVISELTEASSAFLYNNVSDKNTIEFALQNVNNPMYKDFFKNNLKSKFEDEIADAILILLSIAGYLNIDIATHLVLKDQYNQHRKEHSIFNKYTESTVIDGDGGR